CQIDTSPQLVLCKLTEGALNSLIQIINKDTKEDGGGICSLGTCLFPAKAIGRCSVFIPCCKRIDVYLHRE
uniref:Beta-defensin-like domain-containing protein n=1 Tax=Cairina moschata TaxID=8855 RepID=A0A8C3BLM4_CAIMO